MTSTLTALKPTDVAARLKSGAAVLVDIREPDEFSREHVSGAVAAPLSSLEAAHLKVAAGREVIFTCKTGMRTGSNCDRLAAQVSGTAFILEGGLDGWKAAGLPTSIDRKAPIDIMRQVQMTAGGLILLGALLGTVVHPGFWWLSAAVGAGLTFAGATGNCAMAKGLGAMPWNKR